MKLINKENLQLFQEVEQKVREGLSENKVKQ